MIRALALLLLCLPGCASKLVSCDQAPRVRMAASLALEALDRACPINRTAP